MRFKRLSARKQLMASIDITPLIDVVFLLLAFFMLTSSFIFQQTIKVNLPKAITSQAMKKKSVVVTVTSENIIYFQGKAVSLGQLSDFLKRSTDIDTVLVRADKVSSLGRVVSIWDLCRSLHIKQVNLATNQTIE